MRHLNDAFAAGKAAPSVDTFPRGQHAALADQVMGRIRGQQDAQRVLHAIRQGCAPEDALLDALHVVQARGDVERVRGFVREVQKRLEVRG